MKTKHLNLIRNFLSKKILLSMKKSNNLMTKRFLLFLLLSTVFGFSAKSQNFKISVTNITNCTYTVEAFDALNMSLGSIAGGAGQGFSSSTCLSGAIDHIDVKNGSCTITFTFASLPQSISNCACGSSNNVTCSSGINSACGSGTFNILININ
jgi:hypothetical protein